MFEMKFSRLSVNLHFCLLLFFILVSPLSAGGDDAPAVPSWGSGPFEIILFTDYFCKPCRITETKAEALLKELVASKKVKLTFVDVPRTRLSPIYAAYYLYAARTNINAADALRVRKILFDAAQDKKIKTEAALAAYLQKNKIAWKAFDEKSLYPLLNKYLMENKISTTPTCVIKSGPADIKKYIGSKETWEGLMELQARLREDPKR